ncbi:hypothetical protein ACRAWF_18855 [Streptomyces sp. L7]
MLWLLEQGSPLQPVLIGGEFEVRNPRPSSSSRCAWRIPRPAAATVPRAAAFDGAGCGVVDVDPAVEAPRPVDGRGRNQVGRGFPVPRRRCSPVLTGTSTPPAVQRSSVSTDEGSARRSAGRGLARLGGPRAAREQAVSCDPGR